MDRSDLYRPVKSSGANHQVKQMRWIYQNCTTVLMWLNDSHGGRNFSHAADFRRTLDPRVLIDVLENEYFGRLWVVQEIVLAPTVRVLLRGGHWLRWPDMQGVLGNMSTRKLDEIKLSARTLVCHGRKLDTPGRSLLWCISNFSGCDCEEPRDKVFGLTGMVNDWKGRWEHVNIDYGRSVFNVFLDVLMATQAKNNIIGVLTAMRAKDSEPDEAPHSAVDVEATLEALGTGMGLDRSVFSGAQALLNLVSPIGVFPAFVTSIGFQRVEDHHRETKHDELMPNQSRWYEESSPQSSQDKQSAIVRQEWNLAEVFGSDLSEQGTAEIFREKWLSVSNDIAHHFDGTRPEPNGHFYSHEDYVCTYQIRPGWEDAMSLDSYHVWEILVRCQNIHTIMKQESEQERKEQLAKVANRWDWGTANAAGPVMSERRAEQVFRGRSVPRYDKQPTRSCK
jgi:hypothetical protein